MKKTQLTSAVHSYVSKQYAVAYIMDRVNDPDTSRDRQIGQTYKHYRNKAVGAEGDSGLKSQNPEKSNWFNADLKELSVGIG